MPATVAPAELFPPAPGSHESLGQQARVLRGFALPALPELMPALREVVRAAPLRHLRTPGGRRMSVAMTNCGPIGWVSDARGYRYDAIDPARGEPWPQMPPAFALLASEAAEAAGFPDFRPDACLVNLYRPGTRLTLHQDRDELDLRAPIVSVSLGMSATFLFGGNERGASVVRVALHHGDVVAWGGVDRLRYHGVLPLPDAPHPQLGARRINLTFRKAAASA